MKKLIYSILISIFLLNIVCSAQVLKIDNFLLKQNGETEVISLKKSGEVSVNQQVIGKLSKDGFLKDTNGKTIAAISKLGLVTDGDKTNYGMIDKNGSINNGSGKSLNWTKDGKFQVSEKDYLTISPNKKKFYQTASFLILLNFMVKQSFLPPTQSELIEDAKFNYKDTDVVLSIETGVCQGNCDSLLTLFGNGNLAYTGSYRSSNGVTVVGKTTRTKINQLLQKAEDINFPNLPPAPSRPYVHDGSSTTTRVWFDGKLIKIGCAVGEGCPIEAVVFSEFIHTLFAEEINKLK